MATRTRNQVIAFRVTPAERRQVSAKIKRSGLSQQEYLLDAALHHPIYVMEELKPLLSELRAWGQKPKPADCPGPSGASSDCLSAGAYRGPGKDL